MGLLRNLNESWIDISTDDPRGVFDPKRKFRVNDPENTEVNIEDVLYDHTQFSPEEVSRGKQTLRNLLRSGSPNKRLDHLSEQLKLF